MLMLHGYWFHFMFSDQMLTIHYYLLFDGPDEHLLHIKTLYKEGSTFRYWTMRDFFFFPFLLFKKKLLVLKREGLNSSNIVSPYITFFSKSSGVRCSNSANVVLLKVSFKLKMRNWLCSMFWLFHVH